MNKVISALSALYTSVHFPASQRVFNALVYGWFLVNAALVWNERHLIWGVQTVLMRFGATDRTIDNLVYALVYDLGKYPYVFYPHLVFALLSITDRWWSFAPRILCWVTGILLYYSAIPAFNSGMLIILLMAFYAIPAYTRALHPVRVLLTNTSRWACVIQLMLCYLYSAIYKLTGPMWLKGEAVYYSFNIDRFSGPFLQSLTSQHWLMMLLTYVSLAYQVLFPLAIVIRRIKGPMLIIGTVFHLAIGFGMHLWDFALAMIFCYAILLNEDVAERWFGRLFFTRNKTV